MDWGSNLASGDVEGFYQSHRPGYGNEHRGSGYSYVGLEKAGGGQDKVVAYLVSRDLAWPLKYWEASAYTSICSVL